MSASSSVAARVPERLRRPELGVAAVCALAALYLGGALGEARTLQQANQNGVDGDFVGAERLAGQVRRPPADGRALLTAAYALRGQGRRAAASRAFRRAATRDPNNWVIRRDLAVVLADLGQRERARREMERALALNPSMVVPRGFRPVRPTGRRR